LLAEVEEALKVEKAVAVELADFLVEL